MATKGCESTAHHRSSIALLQERFRQLQRAKEMRKEKELLRLFSEPEIKSGPNRNYEPTGLFFHSHEPLLPHHATRPGIGPSQYQSSLYLQPNLQAKQGGEPGPIFANINGSAGSGVSYNMAYGLDDNSDVDTSLHL